jgi:glycosyltransferase involved in cell wall biosynthesis
MRVLYVNHTATLGGGERSLIELLSALPGEVSPTLACPEGALASIVRGLGVPVMTMARAEPSFRFDPLRTPRALADLSRAAFAVRRTARRCDTELIHANSVRAGLAAVAGTRLGGPPVVVHVRDCLPQGTLATLTRRTIRSGSSLVIANSAYTADRFQNSFHLRIRVIHNSVDLETFDPCRIDREDARTRLGLDSGAVALGVVAQITPWKGQDDAVRALAHVRRAGVNAHLLIVGEAKFTQGSERFNNRSYERSLHALVDELNLGGSVHFLGERTDIPEILRALDLLLVPSWEEPFGRSVVEALAMQVPVIATSVGGPAEIVRDGGDGILLPPKRPERWAEEACHLLADPERLASMGRQGRAAVEERFTRDRHLKAVLDAYSEAIGGRQP